MLLIFDVLLRDDSDKLRLVSAGGVLVLLLFGFIFSAHPGHVVWRHTVWGVAIEFVFGLILLRWDPGRDFIQCLADKVSYCRAKWSNNLLYVLY